MIMRVLELGTSLAPAYAGMILQEQHHQVIKWASYSDAIWTMNRAHEMWHWLNYNGKTVFYDQPAWQVADTRPDDYDIVIDNFRVKTWADWKIDPAEQAERMQVTWVSLRADDDGRSFDLIAQAKGWGDHGRMPFLIGDTVAGLWLAYKALAAPVGHHIIRQAACLAKLIEGEGVAPWDADRPWLDPDRYAWNDRTGATVKYRDETISEPPRDAAWRSIHLPMKHGRYVI